MMAQRKEATRAISMRASGGIQSLDAALSLLRAMALFAGPTSLTDLARAAGMPASKAHRYLASFVHAGLVIQSGRSGRYDLGPLAAEIGLSAIHRNSFVNRAADRLEELGLATGLTVLLTVWGTQGPTVVRWERTTSFTATTLGLGSTLPLLTSASGRVFLAFLPRRLIEERLKMELKNARKMRLSWPDLEPTAESVQALIAEVRRQRFAAVDGRLIPGLKAIAAPVTNWQGEIEVAVTLVGTDDAALDPRGNASRQLAAFTSALSIRETSRPSTDGSRDNESVIPGRGPKPASPESRAARAPLHKIPGSRLRRAPE
jgi:DNA-binding IclR family transcriptional regulator